MHFAPDNGPRSCQELRSAGEDFNFAAFDVDLQHGGRGKILEQEIQRNCNRGLHTALASHLGGTRRVSEMVRRSRPFRDLKVRDAIGLRDSCGQDGNCCRGLVAPFDASRGSREQLRQPEVRFNG